MGAVAIDIKVAVLTSASSRRVSAPTASGYPPPIPRSSVTGGQCMGENGGKSVVPWAAFAGEGAITRDASTSRAVATTVAGGTCGPAGQLSMSEAANSSSIG